MPPRRPNPERRPGSRWVVAQRDLGEHVTGSPPAHVALIYDPSTDLIISAGVETTVDVAVAAAFERVELPPAHGPGTLACDPRVLGAVRLQTARFATPPIVEAAVDAELRAMARLFEDFLAHGPASRAHLDAVDELEDAARRFIDSACWTHRADSQALLLDASIDGERAGGLVSVMGNGGEAFGVSIVPDGESFSAVLGRDGPGMPPDGVLSCVLDRRALRDPTLPAVEMAVRIRNGEAEPARGREVQLLHTALSAAAEAPRVGAGEPVSGTVTAAGFDASYVVFDVEGAERTLQLEAAAQTPTHAGRVTPQVRFGVLPRAAAEALVSPDDELPWALLSALPEQAGMPAVFVGYDTVSEAQAFVRAAESGHYLGVSAERTLVGTRLRLIGRGEPLTLGIVGNNWPPLRSFIRRRAEAGGLHALVVAVKGIDSMEGVVICVLPQAAPPPGAGERRHAGAPSSPSAARRTKTARRRRGR